MNDLNQVALTGRLTKPAILKYTNNGMPFLEFSIGVNRRQKVGDDYRDVGEFFDVTWFGRGAEALARYMPKGKQVAVSGRLRQSKWTDQSGAARQRVTVLAEDVALMGKKDESGANKGRE